MTDSVRVVYITIPHDEAERMARSMVEERLAACVNIVPRVTSYFWWDERVQHDEEALLIIKTTEDKFPMLVDWVVENHPYELPEIIGMPVVVGSPDYVAWVKQETRGK